LFRIADSDPAARRKRDRAPAVGRALNKLVQCSIDCHAAGLSGGGWIACLRMKDFDGQSCTNA
jgi:hypothetical protein